jgi:CspA family cold shock protein
MDKATGVVKWFSRLKGYGFINPDDGGQEIFVEFELVDDGKGPQAQGVNARRS